jgi:hypothetical protein
MPPASQGAETRAFSPLRKARTFVGEGVAVKMVEALELLEALCALVRAVVRVGRQVLVERALVGERLLADRADVFVPLAHPPEPRRPRRGAAPETVMLHR